MAGGDRLWIAPELEIFYGDDGEWRCPPELDPGSWSAVVSGDEVLLSQEALGCTLARVVRSAVVEAPRGLDWAAYELSDTVRALRGWSAWHVVMVPAPARIFVRDTNEPVVYYAPAPPIAGGWIDASDEPPRWKLGFGPPADGRFVLGAAGPEDPGPLVVVTGEADPAGTYVDVPPDGGVAAPVQVYCSGGQGFCELEHHAPLETRAARSTVVGAWGPMRARLDLLRSLC